MAAGEGVDEAGTVALPQDVEDTGLVEVSEVNNVLHCVLVGGACLGRGERGGVDSVLAEVPLAAAVEMSLKSHDCHMTHLLQVFLVHFQHITYFCQFHLLRVLALLNTHTHTHTHTQYKV